MFGEFLKITNVSWKFLESRALRWYSGSLFRCCHRYLYCIIICRLIVYFNKIKSVFFCYKEVLGLLYLMTENLLISCIVLPCDRHSACISSMYSMKHLSEDSLAFIWICISFESGCQCCCLFPYPHGSGGGSTGTLPGCLEKQWILNQQHKGKIQRQHE